MYPFKKKKAEKHRTKITKIAGSGSRIQTRIL